MILLGHFYSISCDKSRRGSDHVRVTQTCPLHKLLLDAKKVEPCLGYYPFFEAHGELWLTIENARRLPLRADTSEVIFLAEDSKMRCYWKNMQPFALSHYIDEGTLSLVESNTTDKPTLRVVQKIRKLTTYPSFAQRNLISNFKITAAQLKASSKK